MANLRNIKKSDKIEWQREKFSLHCEREQDSEIVLNLKTDDKLAKACGILDIWL